MGKILLFYKYVTLENPIGIMRWQHKLCKELNLKGRIILATEGINATVGGSVENTERYKVLMSRHHLFGGIDFKEAPGDADCFPRMRIVVKNEIVHLGLDTQKVSVKDTGKHLTPAQTHELIAAKPKDLVILDARNNYEARVGKFTNAVVAPIKHFRELPTYIDNNLEQFKDKDVLMYCTGGIRCERATAYLATKGVAKNIYQIEGGIHRYIEQFPDGYFRGKNYVFDGRVTVQVNDDVLATCDLCSVSCDEFNNCLNASCNKHFIGCPPCIATYQNCCSAACLENIRTGAVTQRPLFKKVPQKSTPVLTPEE
ncbi:MAG TPA: rhodanese-related sulfurtransferase [Candidatus Limnocylindria bacterium]|nr:rhodanese-related sulfurtransferase [Candidatus Limnocylindria bacterium]